LGRLPLEREKLSNACPNVVDWFEKFTDSLTNSLPSTDIKIKVLQQ